RRCARDPSVVGRLRTCSNGNEGGPVDGTAPARTPVRRRSTRRLLSAGLMAALVLGVAGCGGQQEQRSAQNLCGRYQALVASVDEVKAAATGTPTEDGIPPTAAGALA